MSRYLVKLIEMEVWLDSDRIVLLNKTSENENFDSNVKQMVRKNETRGPMVL